MLTLKREIFAMLLLNMESLIIPHKSPLSAEKWESADWKNQYSELFYALLKRPIYFFLVNFKPS